jgi:hypothetical protein
MAPGFTEALTEMSTRNVSWESKARPAHRLTLPPCVSGLSRKCGSLDVLHPYGSQRYVTGIVLLNYNNSIRFFICGYLLEGVA